MIELLTQGYSYRAIGREMGLAYTTVRRMAPDAARMSALVEVVTPVPMLPVECADAPGTTEAT